MRRWQGLAVLVRCGGGFIVFVALLDHEGRTIESAKMKLIVESGGSGRVQGNSWSTLGCSTRPRKSCVGEKC